MTAQKTWKEYYSLDFNREELELLNHILGMSLDDSKNVYNHRTNEMRKFKIEVERILTNPAKD
jgi:hypothetical protein